MVFGRRRKAKMEEAAQPEEVQERQAKLLSLLPKDGVTGWDASRLLFPNAGGYHRFLAVSETIAHLDYAVSEGRLQMERRGDEDVYHLS